MRQLTQGDLATFLSSPQRLGKNRALTGRTAALHISKEIRKLREICGVHLSQPFEAVSATRNSVHAAFWKSCAVDNIEVWLTGKDV